MCGRFTLFAKGDAVAERFNLPEVPILEPRYNVSPTQRVPVVGLEDDHRVLLFFRWGFTPHWDKDPQAGYKPVNAKAETVATTPMFRDAFKRRRCIMPADGFYEWKAIGKKKYPVRFSMADGKPFGFAAVWDVWKGGADPLYSCALLRSVRGPNSCLGRHFSKRRERPNPQSRNNRTVSI